MWTDQSRHSASASSARTRLLVLTILVPLLLVLPTLFLVVRTARQLGTYRKRFLSVTLGGLEMVWLPVARPEMGERAMGAVLADEGLWCERQGLDQGAAVDKDSLDGPLERSGLVVVHSLASIPDTAELDKLVEERSQALHFLRRARRPTSRCVVLRSAAARGRSTDSLISAELRTEERKCCLCGRQAPVAESFKRC